MHTKDEQLRSHKPAEYVVYCDESSNKGSLYVDFYGGSIVRADKLPQIEAAMNAKKDELNLRGEIKWTKVTESYLSKYQEVIHLFFDYVRSGDIHVRVMFRRKTNQRTAGDGISKDDRYFKLYYQFLKHSFGFRLPASYTGEYYVHFLLDELPDHSADAERFKDFLCALPQTADMMGTGLKIRKRDIGEVKSHEHVVLQCTDIVLGAMFFRLNRLNEEKPEGQRKRGKRTVAKEKLYKTIRGEIATIHPNFNSGVSTGARGREYPHWDSPYEHWLFESAQIEERCPINPT